MGIGLCVYGSQETPQSFICKLESEFDQWSNSVQVLKPETQGTKAVMPVWPKVWEQARALAKVPESKGPGTSSRGSCVKMDVPA
jgi:hypothetical protein